MTDLGRRELMIGASLGAGLLLNACSGGTTEARILGPGDPWGDLAGSKPTSPLKPEFLCAVYLKLDGGKLVARHAYGQIDKSKPQWPDDPASCLDLAGRMFEALKVNDYRAVPEIVRVEQNFANFSLKRRQLIVFLIDNDSSDLDFHHQSEKFPAIQFTPYGAVKFKQSDPAKPGSLIDDFARQKNFAFRNLGTSSTINTNSWKGKSVLTLEFFNTDEQGKDIEAVWNKPETHFIYSMNIHLLCGTAVVDDQYWPKPPADRPDWPSAGTGKIPLILDPDVGNNGGDP